MTRGDDWKIVQFLEGIESAAEAPADIIAWLLSDARPPATFSNDFEWCQHLARNPAELSTILGQKQLVDKLAQGLSNQMAALLEQTAATAAEQNDKFLANVDALLEYGRRDVFDGGLANWIGVPNKTDPMMEMYREHNDYDYSSKEFYVWNYGTTTSPKTEWIGAAGVWAPGNKSHALKPGFELPRETKNIEPETHHQPRRVVCLNLFLHTPTADEARQWQLECKEDVDRLSPLDRSRRLVYKAGLRACEVLALRLWSGPMYSPYNAVLRSGTRNEFTTTLHVLVSAVIKLTRVGVPERVFRGISGRAITLDDFNKGVFVEKGAQSFTRDKSVAMQYARPGAGGSSYLLEVQEGEADQGADISSFSYYPLEAEKLYPPLALMQMMKSSIGGRTLKLKMRVNINLHDGTMDEAITQRQREVVGRHLYITQDCREAWWAIESSMARDFGNPGGDAHAWHRVFQQRKMREESLLAEMFGRFRNDLVADWFNDDNNYKKAVQDIIDFRRHSTSRIIISVISAHRLRDAADRIEREICKPDVNFCHFKSLGVLNDSLRSGDCESNCPVYAAYQAGLHNVVECMMQLRVGFRREEIAETEFLVLQARRKATAHRVRLVLSVAVSVLGCAAVVSVFFQGDVPLAWNFLITGAGIPLFTLFSVDAWILRTKPPPGDWDHAVWFLQRNMGPAFLFVIPPLCPHWMTFQIPPGDDKPIYQWTFWPFAFAWCSISLAIVYLFLGFSFRALGHRGGSDLPFIFWAPLKACFVVIFLWEPIFRRIPSYKGFAHEFGDFEFLWAKTDKVWLVLFCVSFLLSLPGVAYACCGAGSRRRQNNHLSQVAVFPAPPMHTVPIPQQIEIQSTQATRPQIWQGLVAQSAAEIMTDSTSGQVGAEA